MAYDGTLKFDTSIDSSGFQDGIDNISGIASKGIKATAAIIGGAATAVSGFAATAIKAGSDFEAGMSKVQAISGASGDEIAKLADKAKEMGAKTKFSATESAEAMQYMAMAGWKTGDMLNGIEGIMNLAAASGEDLASTSDIVTDALTAFGEAADQSGKFADALAAAASNSNTNVAMLGESFKYVAPVAGALGYSYQDVSVALGLMANSGIKASMAGTSLRQLFTNLAKPTDSMAAAMDYLGISLQDDEENMKSLMDVMQDFRKSFGKCQMPMDEFQSKLAELDTQYANGELTEKKYNKALQDLTEKAYGAEGALKAKYAATLAGTQGMSGLLAIVNSSDDDFDKLTEAIYNSDGAAEKMADTMNDNLQGAITLAKSALESVQIALYEKVQEPMKDTVKTVTSMLEDMNNSLAENGFNGLVISFASSLAQLAQMGLDEAPKLVELAGTLCDTFIQEIMKHAPEFSESGAKLATTIIETVLSFAGTFWSAAATLITEFLAGMADNLPQIVETGKAALSQFADSLVDNAPSLGASATKIIITLVSELIQGIPEILDVGKQFVQGLIEGIKQESPQIGSLLEGIFDGFTSVIGPELEVVQDLVRKIFDVLKDADPNTLRSIGEAIGKIAAAFVTLKTASAVAGTVRSATSAIQGFASGAKTATSIIPKLVEGFSLIKGGAGTFSEVLALEFPKIAGITTKIGGVFSGLGSAALTGLSSLGSTIVSGIGGIVATLGGPLTIAIVAAIAGIIAIICNWDAVKEFFTETLPDWWENTAIPFFEGIPDAIMSAVGGLADKVVEWGTSIGETISTVVPEIISSVVDFFTELPGKIGDAIAPVIETLVSWGSNVVSWITQNVPVFIENIISFYSQLPGKIWNILSLVLSKISDWGSKALSYVVENVPKIISKIVDFFAELPGKIWTWLSKVIDKVTSWGSEMLKKATSTASRFVSRVVDTISRLPGKIWEWLSETIDKVSDWASDMMSMGAQAASTLVNAVINGVSGLPGEMVSVGSNIVSGVWNGICNAAGWFRDSVYNFFSNIVSNAKSALGIHSPSRVFADEVGQWIPPGITEGIESKMPDLYKKMDTEMASLGRRMQSVVRVETGKITLDKNINTTYKLEKEKAGTFTAGDTTVEIAGETHVHVELDGKEVGKAQTPIIDKNMARIDAHKRRGG
ncbi:phage tail tape measure protein [Blautia obeum]|uniref:phage tail tape measure protein n=1 Tax=Blautia obeum TaxID=40520 RepID=UPI0035681EE5